MNLAPALRRLAEESNAYVPIGERFERIEDPRYVVFLFRDLETHPEGTTVLRLRLAAEEVEDTVAEVRALLASRNRRHATWETTSASTPDDLHGRLEALGMVPHAEPVAAAMALLAEPPPAPADVTVTRVETLEDYRHALEIAAEAFEMGDAALEEMLDAAPRAFDEQQRVPWSDTFLAWIGGEPVAAASATYADAGVVLNGGSTRPAARGRGAYRALVRARWEEAARRGTPAVVTQAGSMSRPILERLGFRTVGEIRILLDEIAA